MQIKHIYKLIVILSAVTLLTLSACSPTQATQPTQIPEEEPTSAQTSPEIDDDTAEDKDTQIQEDSNDEDDAEDIGQPDDPEEEPASDNSTTSDTNKDCYVVDRNDVLLIDNADPRMELSEDDRSIGPDPDEALINIVIYSDPQCPACSGADPILQSFQANHSDDVRLSFRYTPLPYHENGAIASQAMEAAHMQDPYAFWDVTALLFENQAAWADMDKKDFVDWVTEQANDLGLDPDQFEKDMTSKDVEELVQQITQNSLAVIDHTPTILINGQEAELSAEFPSLLEGEYRLLQIEDQIPFECPTAILEDGKDYQAVLHTEKGDITIDLLEENAPLAVNTFLFLVDTTWYDNMPFFRIAPGSVAMTGDPSGTSMGMPGFLVKNELDDSNKYDEAGVVGMLTVNPMGIEPPPEDGVHSGMFFITLGPVDIADQYSVFGKVTDGIEAFKELEGSTYSQTGTLIDGDRISSITIEEIN